MARSRWRWDSELKRLVNLDEDWNDAPRRALTATEEITYGKLQATDGTPLDTKRKHREYMAHHGLAMESDFKETRAKAAAERESFYRGERARDVAERREQLGRAAYELSQKRKR